MLLGICMGKHACKCGFCYKKKQPNMTCVSVKRPSLYPKLLTLDLSLPFLKRQILDCSKLKVFADDNFKLYENGSTPNG